MNSDWTRKSRRDLTAAISGSGVRLQAPIVGLRYATLTYGISSLGGVSIGGHPPARTWPVATSAPSTNSLWMDFSLSCDLNHLLSLGFVSDEKKIPITISANATPW